MCFFSFIFEFAFLFQVLVNSFSITDKDLNSVGIGIYLAASIIDHSCKPNAYASFIGTQVYIRALYDMPELDWKKVFILLTFNIHFDL